MTEATDPATATSTDAPGADAARGEELDVRPVPKPQKHPTIFGRFAELAVGESFVLVNNHDPKHLHDEFDREQPGGYSWEYLQREPREWRIRITRLASTSLPRVLTSTRTLPDDLEPDAMGAVWKLPMTTRDLDSNIIALPAGETIDAHAGPELDVMLHVIDGSGTLTTEVGDVDLAAGDVVWLPRRSRRAFAAGPQGLRYLTVHQRRRGIQIMGAPPA